MKKAFSLVLISVLSLSLLLSGCGGLSDVFGGGSKDFSIDLSEGEYEEGGESGYLGDVLHTYWFHYAIDEAYLCETYGGYTPPDGSLLLVVHMGIKNTTRSSLDMFDTDFQVWWNDDADDAYSWPLTTSEDIDDDQIQVDSPLSDAMFPETYSLAINETRVGELIYQVPAKDPDGRDNRDFTMGFVEFFDTNEVGDYYFIDFTAEKR